MRRASALEPAATLFIDDSQKNVDGARAAGWQAVLFDERRPRSRPGRCVRDGTEDLAATDCNPSGIAGATAPARSMPRRAMRRSSSICGQPAIAFIVPERPAVAGVEPLHLGADPVDRAGAVADRERAVGPHPRRPALAGIDRARCRASSAPASIRLTKATRGSARLPVIASPDRPPASGRTAAMRSLRGVDIGLLALDADERRGRAAWPPLRSCRSRRTDRARRRQAWSRPA